MSLSLALPVISFLGALALTPWLLARAPELGWVDRPGHRKLHTRSMPVVGGIAILLGSLPALVLLAVLAGGYDHAWTKIAVVGAAALGAGLIGLVDDREALRGRHKLLWQTVIATVFVTFGFRFTQLDLPALGPVALGIWGVPLTILFIVTVCNGVNLIDGVDGLALSTVSMVLLGTALCAHELGDPVIALLCLTVLGAGAAVLRFNWAPARLYLGDAGSLGLGMLVATAIIAAAQVPGPLGTPAAMPGPGFTYRIPLSALLVLYPLLEVVLSASRRAVKGKAIGRADNDHIHHRLLRRSWTAPAIAQVAVAISGLAAAGVYARVLHFDTIAALLLVLDGLLIGVLLHHCGYFEQFMRSHLRNVRPAFRMSEHFVAMQRLKLRSTVAGAEVLSLLHQTCVELGVERLWLRAQLRDERAFSLVWPEYAASAGEPADGADRTALREGNCWAAWRFDGARPRDLEMEHRLLLDELLLEVLEKLRGYGSDELSAWSFDAGAISCHMLSDRERAIASDAGGEEVGTAPARPPAAALGLPRPRVAGKTR